ncbi:hypothetical protein ACTFIY_006005 [Dictyostelium cf. discoideum]
MSKKYSLLVIGETGCGKSTLINTITNYFLNGEIPDKIKVSIGTKFINSNQNVKSSENDSKDRTKSQTDLCNEYSFKKDSKEYVFIDTPGLSDTRGIKQDDINIGKIIDAAESCSSLSALLIVVNGTVPRMTINLQNVITRLRGSIPDSLLNNVFIVFTNCLGHTRNFDINSLEINVNPEYVFHMNNTAFSTDPKSWDSTSIESLQVEFKLSFKTLDRILESVTKMSSVSTKDFGEMKSHRHNIKAILHKAKADIGNLQKLQDSLAQYQHQLEKANNDKESFKNYTTKQTIEKYELKDAPYHSTLCSTCDHVCHDHCGLQELTTKGDNAFINCIAMSGSNNCRVCPSKCHFNVHYHGRKTMVKVNKTVEQELADMKDKFLKSSQLSSEFSGKILNLDSAKKLANATLNKMTDDIVKSCKELKKICSGFNLVDELQITLNQMEMEAKNSTSFDARKSAEEMIRTIREICDKLNQEESLKTKKKNITIDESKIKNDNSKKNLVDSAQQKQDSNQTKDSNQKPNSKGDNVKILMCPSCKNNFDLDINKYAELKKLGQLIKCKSCHTSKNSNSSDIDKNSISNDKKLNCPTCKNDFQINKDKFKELAKNGQTVICKSCKSNKQNDHTSKNSNSNDTDKNQKSNDKKLNCPTCKNDFQINKDKFRELAKNGQTVICKSCKSNKQNHHTSKNSNSNDTDKNQKSNDKKLNCPTCKKDFQINKDKFKELSKNGQTVICKSCNTNKQNASKSNDKTLNCPTCKKDFQINKDKYKQLAIKGQTILCKSCKAI